jgi:hypothetical protein
MDELVTRRKLWGRVVSVRTGVFEAMNDGSLVTEVTPSQYEGQDQADLKQLVSTLPSPSDIVFVCTSRPQVTLHQNSESPDFAER